MPFALANSVPAEVDIGNAASGVVNVGTLVAGSSVVGFLAFSGDTDAIASVTCSGETPGSLVSTGARSYYLGSGGAPAASIDLFYLSNVANAGAKTVTALPVGGTMPGGRMVMFGVTGGDTGALFVKDGFASGSTGEQASVTLTALPANCLILAVCCAAYENDPAPVGGSGYVNIPVGNWNGYTAAMYLLDSGSSGDKTVTMQWTGSGNQPWMIKAAAFKPLGGGVSIVPLAQHNYRRRRAA